MGNAEGTRLARCGLALDEGLALEEGEAGGQSHARMVEGPGPNPNGQHGFFYGVALGAVKEGVGMDGKQAGHDGRRGERVEYFHLLFSKSRTCP